MESHDYKFLKGVLFWAGVIALYGWFYADSRGQFRTLCGWVLISYLVGFGILCLCAARETARENAQQLATIQAARPSIEKIRDQLVTELVNRHPLISFSFQTTEELQSRSDAMLRRRPWDLGAILKEAMKPVIENVALDFQNWKSDSWPSLSLQTEPFGSDEFWEYEPLYRKTDDGTNPTDWEDRREVVFMRDGGRCQRCGISVAIEECHVHHLLKRSKGGDHSLTNLITLCQSCHALMPEHEHMKEITTYYVIGETIHAYQCSQVRRNRQTAERVRGFLPDLVRQGFKPCRNCKPWHEHESAQEWWKPDIWFFAESRVKEMIDEEVARITHGHA